MSDASTIGTGITGPAETPTTFRRGDFVTLDVGSGRRMGRAVRDPDAEGAMLQSFAGRAPFHHAYGRVLAVVPERMACNFMVALAGAFSRAGVSFSNIYNGYALPLANDQFQHFTPGRPADVVAVKELTYYLEQDWITVEQAELLYCLAFGTGHSPHFG